MINVMNWSDKNSRKFVVSDDHGELVFLKPRTNSSSEQWKSYAQDLIELDINLDNIFLY